MVETTVLQGSFCNSSERNNEKSVYKLKHYNLLGALKFYLWIKKIK